IEGQKVATRLFRFVMTTKLTQFGCDFMLQPRIVGLERGGGAKAGKRRLAIAALAGYQAEALVRAQKRRIARQDIAPGRLGLVETAELSQRRRQLVPRSKVG